MFITSGVFLLLSLSQDKVPAQNNLELKLPPYTGPKKRAAVAKFEIKTQGILIEAAVPSGGWGSYTLDIGPASITQNDFGDGMANMLVTALIDSKRFVVLERSITDEVTKELQLPGVDPTTAVAQGKFLGAQIFFAGAITQVSYRKTQQSLSGGILGSAPTGSNEGPPLKATGSQERVSFTATTTIDLRVIDVETLQVLDSVKAEGKVTSTATNLNLKAGTVRFGNSTFDGSPIAKSIRAAINEAIKKVVQRLDVLPWEARIATISSNSGSPLLYLNFGSDTGIPDGTELEIFRPGAVVIDPQTRVVIGREDDTLLGKCKTRNSTKSMTIAIPSEGTDFQPGDGVRLLKTKEILNQRKSIFIE